MAQESKKELAEKNYDDFDRPVENNAMVGKKPRLLGVPSEMVVPFGIIVVLSWSMCVMFYLPSYLYCILPAWLCLCWAVLAGKRSYHFINQFIPFSAKDWINGNTLFIPATEEKVFKKKRKKLSKISVQISEKPIKRENFMPFQNNSDLHAILDIDIEGTKFSCLLLYNAQGWSANIPFHFQPIHTESYRDEIVSHCQSLDHAFCESFPYGESCQFILTKSSQYEKKSLERLARETGLNLPFISTCLESQIVREKELTQIGYRQEWRNAVWGTWTQNRSTIKDKDWIGWFLDGLGKGWNDFMLALTGKRKDYQKIIYCQLAEQIYQEGYTDWLSFYHRAGLPVRPMSGEEIYQHYIWGRFRDKIPKSLVPPQKIIVNKSEENKELICEIIENRTDRKDAITLAIGGGNCPSKVTSDTLRVKNKYVAALVLEDGGESDTIRWQGMRDMVLSIWKIMSSSFLKDTELYLEISKDSPREIRENLIKIVRQSSYANEEAFKLGKVMDQEASERQLKALEAQEILKHQAPLTVAFVLLVYRDTPEELNYDCCRIIDLFSPFKIIREQNIAWSIFTETLPFNTQRQLSSLNKWLQFAERRIHFTSSTIRGVLPLSLPDTLGTEEGVEYIYSHGGYPIYVDLFTENGTALFSASRGSGKSVKVQAYIRNALARGIPTLGIDLAIGGNSSYKLATELLGESGAYINILERHYNVLQPPDLRCFSEQDKQKRLDIWLDKLTKALLILIMGQSEDYDLRQRVESLLILLLKTFFDDPEIKQRYNLAFDHGFGSGAWQQMPTLKDLLRLCSVERLGIYSPQEIDYRGITQIERQLEAKLSDPLLKKVLAYPSDISPAPMLQIFTFSDVGGGINAMFLATITQMIAQNLALSSQKSFCFVDECNSLLGNAGFDNFIGDSFTQNRKFGQSFMLIGQEINSIKESKASAKIFKNLNYAILGKTIGNIDDYCELLNIPYYLARRTASGEFAPDKFTRSSRWLINNLVIDRCWDCQFYSPDFELAALANQDYERLAKERFLKAYPNHLMGKMIGLAEFTPHYIQSLKQGTRIDHYLEKQYSTRLEKVA